MKVDKQTKMAVMVLLAVALVMSAAGTSRSKRSAYGGTGGGGGPRFLGENETATPEFVKRTHPIAPVDLGPWPAEGGQDIPPSDPEVVKNDMVLDGHIAIDRFDERVPALTVLAFAGGPVLRDPQAPEPSVQKTYLPEKSQIMPQSEDCLFWFSPYLQLTLRWDYLKQPKGKPHVVLTGHWYRKTYTPQ